MEMNTKNESKVEPFVEKLADLNIDPTTSQNITSSTETNSEQETLNESIKRQASDEHEYTTADLVPVDSLGFHYLQATALNNGIPAWNPGSNVLSYVKYFMPTKKARLSENVDQKLNSSSGHELKIDGESGLFQLPDGYVSDSVKHSFDTYNQNGQCDEKSETQEKD